VATVRVADARAPAGASAKGDAMGVNVRCADGSYANDHKDGECPEDKDAPPPSNPYSNKNVAKREAYSRDRVQEAKAKKLGRGGIANDIFAERLK